MPTLSVHVRRLVVAAFVVYVALLLVWLALGLLPLASDHLASLRQWLEHVAASGGRWATTASRVLTPEARTDAAGSIVAAYAFSLVNLAMGVLLLVRRPDATVPRLLAFALLGTAATFNGPSHVTFHVLPDVPAIMAAHFTYHVASGVAFFWAVVLFPDGHLPLSLRWTRATNWTIALAITAALAFVCWRSSFISHPPFFVVFFGILIPVVGIPLQTLRRRLAVDPETRQQSRLLRGALVPALVAAVVWLGGWIVVRGDGADWARRLDVRLEDVFPAAFVVVPIVLCLAVLRYRLWDIDVLVSRTLLYGLLIAGVVAVYAVAVTVIGVAFGSGPWAKVLAMSLAVVAVEPIRARFHDLANVVVFGQAMSPTEAMRSLADGLERFSPVEELTELARVVVTGTRAASASVWLLIDDRLLLAASWPPRAGDLTSVPLPRSPTLEACGEALAADHLVPIRHHGDLLGMLDVSLHPGVPLRAADERLVDDLSGHAGLLVHNAHLTAELARHADALAAQAEALHASRLELVTTHDAERRSIERDLHDGAQQRLVGLLIALRALPRDRSDPAEDDVTTAGLTELRGRVRSTMASIEDLVGGNALAGPGGGIVAALRREELTLARAGLRLEVVDERTAATRADVDTQVYFCCLEALQNAAKHARATIVTIRLWTDGDGLGFDVADDGAGFDPAGVARSSGLHNIAERTEAMGGYVVIEAHPTGGTRVRGRVPAATSAMAATP